MREYDSEIINAIKTYGLIRTLKEPEDVVERPIDGKECALSPACDDKIFLFGYPMITIDKALMLATVLASSTYPMR
jgi:hypothetical protein